MLFSTVSLTFFQVPLQVKIFLDMSLKSLVSGHPRSGLLCPGLMLNEPHLVLVPMVGSDPFVGLTGDRWLSWFS